CSRFRTATITEPVSGTYRPFIFNSGNIENPTATWTTSTFTTDIQRRDRPVASQLYSRCFENIYQVFAGDDGWRRRHARLRQRRAHGSFLHQRRGLERSDVERRPH